MADQTTNSKRLLIIFDVAYPFIKGGAQRRFYEISKSLVSRGWKVDWMSFKCWEGASVNCQDGITYIGIGKLPHLYNESGKRSKIEPLHFLFGLLRNISKLLKYDVIWLGQWPLLHLIPAVLLLKLGKKTVIVDWWELWGKRVWMNYSRSIGLIGFLIESITVRIVGKFAIIVTDSKVEQHRIQSKIGQATNVYFAANGVPRNEIGPVDLNDARTYDIVYFGRLKDHKRVDMVLYALRILADQYGLCATAAIIGDGPERSKLEALAAHLKISKQLHFFGKVSKAVDMYKILKQSAVCAVTTMGGGGGNLSLLEANACGLPVIAFKCEDGIDTDLITEGQNGLLVHPATAEALARNIYLLLKDAHRLRKMKEYSLRNSYSYDWEKVSDIYENIMSRIRVPESSA